MHATAEESANVLIRTYGQDKALQTAKDILAMYVRGLNEYWTEHYKKIVEYIEIYIEEHK
jgi:hypothetical protein